MSSAFSSSFCGLPFFLQCGHCLAAAVGSAASCRIAMRLDYVHQFSDVKADLKHVTMLQALTASLTNATISVLRLLPNPHDILRAVAENIQWSPSHLLNLLAFKI
ncbi:MAG: hypothetical protein LBU65_04415 [Planctomycetaceae bacterium]|nr:hypothetical protein [Planctomycetaceae bacterium]